MERLGFTFYPKDWWTSESYFELLPLQRYYYLECLFIMYSNDGYMKTQKTQFENRIRTQVLNEDWESVISKFVLENNLFTHISVNKRMRKALANKENGKKGGRPKKDSEKPKKPNSETQNNPPSESEKEKESKLKEIKNNDFCNDLLNSEQWIESVSMSSKHKYFPEETKSMLKRFNSNINLKFDYKLNKSDYTNHFINWLDTQPKPEPIKKDNRNQF